MQISLEKCKHRSVGIGYVNSASNLVHLANLANLVNLVNLVLKSIIGSRFSNTRNLETRLH